MVVLDQTLVIITRFKAMDPFQLLTLKSLFITKNDTHSEPSDPDLTRLRPRDLEYVPDAAIESFASVGYHFDLARLEAGEIVLDLGSGSAWTCSLPAFTSPGPGRAQEST